MKFRSKLLKPIPSPLTEQLDQVLYPYGVGVDIAPVLLRSWSGLGQVLLPAC
jgi:hypothetical protein